MLRCTYRTLAALLICTLLGTVSSANDREPASSEEVVGYKPISVYFTKKTWMSALEHCAHFNQILVGMINQGQAIEVRRTLVREYGERGLSDMNFWTGGNNLGHPTRWTWVSTGKTMDAGWEGDEFPHCLQLENGVLWKAKDCDEKAAFICEHRVGKNG